MTFGVPENFWMEKIILNVVDLKMAYHDILGIPTMKKFMGVPTMCTKS